MNSESIDVVHEFPDKDKIYLNNASVSLMPYSSIKAMSDFLVKYNSLGPDSLESEVFVKEKLIQTRKVISKLIRCQPDEVILTQSTTDGVNIVANGLSTSTSSNIVIRGMGHEHHANYYPWLDLGWTVCLRGQPPSLSDRSPGGGQLAPREHCGHPRRGCA